MAETTKIQWADSTWDPWRGCTKVSPGCANCYAERLAQRNPEVFGSWGKGAPRVVSKSWNEPVVWNRKAAQRYQEWENRWDGTMREAFDPQSIPAPPKPPWVFPSKCDWLDEEVPAELRMRFLNLINETQNLRWLLLTKRPWNFQKLLKESYDAAASGAFPQRKWLADWINGTPPQHVWIGASVEDQLRADIRCNALLQIPATVRFLSVEPLLGPVDIAYSFFNGSDSFGTMPGLDWVIVGGESGPSARPMHLDWLRSIVQQCERAKVPVFVKQLGKRPTCSSEQATEFPAKRTLFTDEGIQIGLEHHAGGDMNEWPARDRIRQLPRVT